MTAPGDWPPAGDVEFLRRLVDLVDETGRTAKKVRVRPVPLCTLGTLARRVEGHGHLTDGLVEAILRAGFGVSPAVSTSAGPGYHRAQLAVALRQTSERSDLEISGSGI